MRYSPILTASVNRKGVLDVDTVKGCSYGMAAHPEGGCYGLCYAAKLSTFYGYDFSTSVSRPPKSNRNRWKIERVVSEHDAGWFRIGTMGDPCHDWTLTVGVAEWLSEEKTPVVITKHWVPLTDEQVSALGECGAVVNTSISPLDSAAEIEYRLGQFHRLKDADVRSVLRIVSCKFGDTEFGLERDTVQNGLFAEFPIIDNPLRIPATDERVKRGDIIVERRPDLGGGSTVSVARADAYIGPCAACPDQCGILPDWRES